MLTMFILNTLAIYDLSLIFSLHFRLCNASIRIDECLYM